MQGPPGGAGVGLLGDEGGDALGQPVAHPGGGDVLLGVCGAHDGGGVVGGVRTGVRGECGAEAVLAVGGGRGVVVLADEHDPPVAEAGQVADDLGAGGDVVGADPGEPFQRVAAADVHGGVAVRDESAQLVVRDVAAEEEATVREPDPVQRPGVPAWAPPGLDPVKRTRS